MGQSQREGDSQHILDALYDTVPIRIPDEQWVNLRLLKELISRAFVFDEFVESPYEISTP
jgi:hypothetical protein